MIALEHISLNYGDRVVLEDFTLHLPIGQTTCILGPSGCGKTTLLHVAGSILSPQRGQVSGMVGQRGAFIFQENRLLPWLDVLENLTVHRIEQPRAVEYLEKVGLCEELHTMPEELSGGMQRRLAIARALAYGEDYHWWDEPLQGLDLETTDRILSLIKTELEAKTALIITHSPEEAFALAQEIILVQGPPLTVRERIAVDSFNGVGELRNRLIQIPAISD